MNCCNISMNLNSHSDIGLSDIYCDDHLIINFDFADTAVLLVCVGNKTIPVVYGKHLGTLLPSSDHIINIEWVLDFPRLQQTLRIEKFLPLPLLQLATPSC